ncbi:hypothetical protein [Chimaeribacter californicus]|nr:hypothetical protein [Chimaeribacter californicus]
MVFFEADDYARATKKIVRLLAEIWGCRESFIGCWNLKDEHELILESDAETPRDWKLFETGAGPAPAYINVTEEGHPLFLVSPVNLQRLYRALAEVSHE